MTSNPLSNPRRIVLTICAMLIVLSAAVLLFDRLFIRERPMPMHEKLSLLCDEFDLQKADPRSTETLQSLLRMLGDDTPEIETQNPILTRRDAIHTLWLFEYQRLGTAFTQRNRPDVTINTTQFGIVFQLHCSPDLPAWGQASAAFSGDSVARPHTTASINRLRQLSGYRMSMKGDCILLTTTPDGWALKQAMEQSTSQEFHPGLFNSAMKIDVQTAVQIVNQMETGSADLPDFYSIDLPPIKIAFSRKTGIQERLEKVRLEMVEKLEADRQRRESNRSESSGPE